MTYESVLLYSALIFVIIPFYFWYRVTYVNKRRLSVRSKCPSCGNIERLDNIKNYSCTKCETKIIYIDNEGNRIEDDTYKCDICSNINLNGIVNCTLCGKEREE